MFDISEVEGYDHDRRAPQFSPFLPNASAGGIGPGSAYFSFHREARVLSSVERKNGVRTGYAGSECYLSLVDRDFAPFHVSLAQLGGSAWVTNRDLPMVMPVGRTSDFTLLDSVPIGSIRCLRGPTKPIAAVTGGAINWRLISHLSINFLALDDLADGGAVVALRELLNLYAERGDGAYRGQVDSLQGVSTKQVVRRVPHDGPIIFGRGVEISVKLDEAAFAGASPFMLGMVLEHFFARHVALNTYSETVLHSVSHGEIYRWPARIGDKPLI
ncbi:MAG: type VI secretion system baseplate subunit TssF [Uliginosibacterium sp.]|nr:type VI secretion system baseplate subunit TssF [Uliginosibacterium sp.]